VKGETNNPLQLVRVWQGCFANRFFICARTCIYKMHLHGYADYYTRSNPPCDHKMHLHRFADFSSRRFTEIAAKCFYDLGITWMNKARSLSATELKTCLAEMSIPHSGSKGMLTNRRVALILSLSLSLSPSLWKWLWCRKTQMGKSKSTLW